MRWTLIVVFLLSFLSQASAGKDSTKVSIKNFSDDWLVYDKYYQSYVPYIRDRYPHVLSVSTRIQIQNYKDDVLTFEAEKDLCLFVDHKILYKNIKGSEETVDIQISEIQKLSPGESLLTFYQPEGKLPIQSTKIVKEGIVSSEHQKVNTGAMIFPRIDFQLMSGRYMIVFLIIIALYTVYKRVFTKEYDYFISFNFGSSTEDVRLPRPLGLPTLYILFVAGMALALIVMIFNIKLNYLYHSPDSFLSKYLTVTFIVFIFLVIRFLYLYVLGWFFNFSKFIVLQYTETIKFFVKVTLFTTVISVMIVFSGYYLPHISLEQFYYFIIITLIGMAVKVIFLFFRLINFRNLYLFSYICAAEVLPIVIMVKILLF